MAAPDDIPNLYAWWRADSLSAVYTDGDDMTTGEGDWEDKAASFDMVPSATNVPYFYEDQIGGHPAVDLGDADGTGLGTLSNTTIDLRTQCGTHTKWIVYKAVRLATNHGGILGGNGGDQSECFYQVEISGTSYMRARYSETGDVRKYADIVCPLNEWHFWTSRQQAASSITLSKDGGAEVSTSVGTRHGTYPQNNLGYIGVDGGSFAYGRIAEAGYYNAWLSDSQLGALQDYLRARYFAVTPEQNEGVRDTLSRRLWVLRRAPGQLQVSAPLWMLDADILDRIALETSLGPSDDGLGWGAKKWQRRAFTIQRMALNGEGDRVVLDLLDRRPLDVLFWDTARTDEAALVLNATRQSGVARLHKGNTFTFTRATQAWIENPADDTTVIEIQQGERALTSGGEYIEREATNEIIQSSFINGKTGWTQGGTGVNGSAIAKDADDQLFNPEMGADSLKFTAGTTHTTDLTLASTATASIAADTDCRLSIDHKTDSGEPLHYRLQRSYDSYYWNNSTPGWQVGSVDNSLGTVSARSPADRYVSENIDVGSNATTLTLTVLLPSGGTSGRISHLYHCQIEEGFCATSRIVTGSATVTRDAAEMKVWSATDKKILDWTKGTIYLEFIPDFDYADTTLTATSPFLFRIISGTYLDCYISGTAFIFRRYVSPTAYNTVGYNTFSRGDVLRLGFRWTSSEGELGLTAHTQSIFINGTLGDSDVFVEGADPTPQYFYMGGVQIADYQCQGAIRNWRIFPYPLTDEEIAALP